jgi:hypothetical protein
MILHKETFKKFGYWPNSLKAGAQKKVLIKCDDCEAIKERERRHLRDINLCIKCAVKKTQRGEQVRMIQAIKIASMKEITPMLWVELYRSASIKRGCGQINPTIVFRKTYINAIETASILKSLKINGYCKTPQLKLALLVYLKDKPIDYRWEAVNRIIVNSANSKRLLQRRTTIFFDVAKWSDVFSLADIKITGGGTGISRITYGSFFIDGQWIHVG